MLALLHRFLTSGDHFFFRLFRLAWDIVVWAAKSLIRVAKLVLDLPQLAKLAWLEIVTNEPCRCALCQADIGGTEGACRVCGYDSRLHLREEFLARQLPFLKSPGSILPLRIFDVTRRISIAGASTALVVGLGAYLGLYLYGWFFYSLEGRSAEYFNLYNPIWFLINALFLVLPLLYFLSNRWLLIAAPKPLAIWSALSLVFVFVFRITLGSQPLSILSIAANLLGALIVLTVLANLLLALFPWQLRRQQERWEEHFAAAVAMKGFSGRPASTLQLTQLNPDRVRHGRLGEEETALNSRGSLESKSILFNSLREPKLPIGDLDHAILIGDRLLLIDSKRWRSGVYSISQGVILRDGKPFLESDLKLSLWIDHYRSKFPSLASIMGLVVMTNPASIIQGSGDLGSGMRLITARELQQILDFERGSNSAVPDAKIVAYFLSLVEDADVDGGARQLELSDYDISLIQLKAIQFPSKKTG